MDFRRGRQESPRDHLVPLIDVMMVISHLPDDHHTYSKYTELQVILPTADPEAAGTARTMITVAVERPGRT